MKTAPTLLDAVYRATFSKHVLQGWRSNAGIRHALENTRRFIADARMSAFMADLANEAFRDKNAKTSFRIADSLRVAARMPHENIWIEYNLQTYQARSYEIRKGEGFDGPLDMENIPKREGWLLQQHPQFSNAIIMHNFSSDDLFGPDRAGFTGWTFPFAYAWTSDDNPLPWRRTVKDTWTHPSYGDNVRYMSEIMVGLPGYCRENISIVDSPLIHNVFKFETDPERLKLYTSLIVEWTGNVRRVWSLLATIDHLPLFATDVRQSKGFLARGRIRKFLDHKTITLNIPAKKDTRVIARQAIAIAHRKRHEVRGHWRDDWRHPPSRLCNPHLWEPMDGDADLIACTQCHGRQIYIHKHERGDATLGYVTHDYLLKHEVTK